MKKRLSVLSLTLITVCSVDSIRNLPAAAIAGSQLFNYFSLALIFFLLPCAIISSWFSNQSQQGVYGWVKKGLGKHAAFMAIWYQCVQNILIYPTLLSFIAGTLLYSISPDLVENKGLLFLIVIFLIWGLTWINLKGIQFSSRFNSFCSITGLLIPFTIIMAMGLYWWLTETPQGDNILPQAAPYSWTSLTAIILSFCGIELAAVHAEESKAGAFPKAIVISVFLIFLSMLFGSIILAMIIPAEQLSFISSIPKLIQLFFTKMHCGHLSFLINGLIAIGCIGTANNWLIAPIKGLGFAAGEGFLDTRLTKLNENKAPAKLLILQALCVSVISTLFLIIPSINASYWIMLNAATQINLLMYLLLFFSAIKVIFSGGSHNRIKILIPSCLGVLGISVALLVSLTPPPSLQLDSQIIYAVLGGLFLVLMTLIPMWSQRKAPKLQEIT
ncbi:APC family permease [Legionella maioricensis]|uniref:APC family permease n=1 Tax=Legionella maioricensis TaxID=2896528 RepID=A0A9X2CZT6_9GAMM|nr:APC family permease [Legionella maioricensis]MCL9683761.1 APC family permease [Legionella maioricensis]MCL9687535.1 APC family permease [Legionella maioricensis]